MLLTVKADTSVKDLVIDYIEVICESGRSISLNWEQSNVRKTETGFYADYLGVCFNDKLANGKLHELYGMQVDIIGLYSEQKGKLDIDVKEMYFYEDEKELTFDNPYQTEDNEAYMEFKSNLEKFIKTQVQDGYEEDFEAFSEDGDESGIYDIVYDMKPLIEENEFNPFSEEERKTQDYGKAFDEWFDCFVESTLFPLVKKIAYERMEGQG